jgi:hypothetical protein
MRRRKLLLLLAGLAVLAVGVVVLWPRTDRITRENYDRIQPGMTRAEVEAILGPPGDYRTGLGETYGLYARPGPAQWDIDSLDNDLSLPSWPFVSLLPWEPDSGQPDPDAELGKTVTWLGDSVRLEIIVDRSDHVRRSFIYNRRMTQGTLDNLLWRAKREWHCWFR